MHAKRVKQDKVGEKQIPAPHGGCHKSPNLDTFMRTEISSSVKTSDKELAKIETSRLAGSPDKSPENREKMNPTQVYDAAASAVELVGNASASLSWLRKKKIITGMNKTLLPLSKEDDNFVEAPPNLFGSESAKQSKEYMEQVKALSLTLLPRREQDSFKIFLEGGPPRRGGAEARTRHSLICLPGPSTEPRTEPQELNSVQSLTRSPSTSAHISPTSVIQCCSAYPKCNYTHGLSCSGYPTENASWTAAIFSEELGTGDKGQVGSRDGKSILHKLLGAEPNLEATHPSIQPEPGLTGGTKSRRTSKEGCGDRDTARGWVLLLPLSGTKEGRWSETSNKSEVSEQPHVHSSLQNGGDSHAKSPITARRLACKGRPEGYLFLHPNIPRPQEISIISARSEQGLLVHLPSIRPVASPHMRAGDAGNILHR